MKHWPWEPNPHVAIYTCVHELRFCPPWQIIGTYSKRLVREGCTCSYHRALKVSLKWRKELLPGADRFPVCSLSIFRLWHRHTSLRWLHINIVPFPTSASVLASFLFIFASGETVCHFQARSQNCEKRLLGLPPSCISVRPSVRPFVRMKQLGSELTDFH
jgi:hypothetical protein